jgi:hypothetical protein
MEMNRFVERQRDHNRQTADGWERFREHRERVTRLLLPDTPHEGQRLCVLGAGNSNDLDLIALTAAYEEVHLVDLDERALKQGVERQQPVSSDRIRLHAGCDLTGTLETLSAWGPATPPQADEIDRTIALALAAPPPCEGRFDVVASVCLLSQLIHSVVVALGADHPRFVELISAVRLRHLRLLAELAAPGGRAVLITDVVSSDTCPTLAAVPPEQLAGLVRQLIEARNFFHGVNPAVIASILCSDPQLAGTVRALEFLPPWRWDLGPRVYAVYAIRWGIAGRLAAAV